MEIRTEPFTAKHVSYFLFPTPTTSTHTEELGRLLCPTGTVWGDPARDLVLATHGLAVHEGVPGLTCGLVFRGQSTGTFFVGNCRSSGNRMFSCVTLEAEERQHQKTSLVPIRRATTESRENTNDRRRIVDDPRWGKPPDMLGYSSHTGSKHLPRNGVQNIAPRPDTSPARLDW